MGCHHRTALMHLPVTVPPCLDMVLLLIMIIPSAHYYRDDLELLSFNLKFPEKEWYVEKKRRVRILGGHTVFIAPHYLWGSTSYKSYGSLSRRLHPRTGLLFVVRLVCSIPSVVNFSVHSHLTDPNKQLQPASALTIDKLESSSNALFSGSSSSEPMEDLGIAPMLRECAMLVTYLSGPYLWQVSARRGIP